MKKAVIEWLAGRLPSCADIARLGSESIERELTWRERFQMRLHLLICVWCQRYVRQIRLLHDTLHAHPEEVTDAAETSLSPDARDRMKRALKAFEEE
jgi:hypothetical protein